MGEDLAPGVGFYLLPHPQDTPTPVESPRHRALSVIPEASEPESACSSPTPTPSPSHSYRRAMSPARVRASSPVFRSVSPGPGDYYGFKMNSGILLGSRDPDDIGEAKR